MIPFVRSNVPQLGMIFDCNNFVFGRSKNVWNVRRSVGGSSGGEAGLIAASCSPIGLGSDIAGSLRIPASFCGVHSLKVGETRLSNCQTYLHFYTQQFYTSLNRKTNSQICSRTHCKICLRFSIMDENSHQLIILLRLI